MLHFALGEISLWCVAVVKLRGEEGMSDCLKEFLLQSIFTALFNLIEETKIVKDIYIFVNMPHLAFVLKILIRNKMKAVNNILQVLFSTIRFFSIQS